MLRFVGKVYSFTGPFMPEGSYFGVVYDKESICDGMCVGECECGNMAHHYASVASTRIFGSRGEAKSALVSMIDRLETELIPA